MASRHPRRLDGSIALCNQGLHSRSALIKATRGAMTMNDDEYFLFTCEKMWGLSEE